jgi:hypothetical protein
MRRITEEAAMSAEEFDHVELVPPVLQLRAYEAVAAVVSDDHNFKRGVEEARAVAHRVVIEAGADALVEMAVELSLRLAEALERIAAQDGVAAVDLAEVWFVEVRSEA